MGKVELYDAKNFIKTYSHLSTLIQTIENILELPENSIQSKCRRLEYVDGRRIFSAIAFHKLRLGSSTIGRFANRTHGSIINLIRTHENIYDTDPLYKENYDDCCLAFDKFMKTNSISKKISLKEIVQENKKLREKIQTLEEKLELIQNTLTI